MHPNPLSGFSQGLRWKLDRACGAGQRLLEVVARDSFQVGFDQRLAGQGQVGALVSANVVVKEVSYPARPSLELCLDFVLFAGVTEALQESIT